MPVFSSKIFRRANGTSHDQEYPVDEYGAEMGENARVWRAYLDEADEYDYELVEGFRDTTDVLLVFAGLFSAAVSAFVTLSSQTLQPDYGQITAALMTELVNLQRAVASGGNVSQIPPSSLSFTNDNTTESVDRWVNALWLTSLTLSLVAALVAVLAKQWLIHYVSALSGIPRRRVLVRHFRFMGLEKWRVSTIIAALPVLLHLSLFMFLGGLVLFVWQQDLSIAAVILAITSLTFIFYVLSNILAAFIPDCSYKTPVSLLFNYLQRSLNLRITRRYPRGLKSAGWQLHSLRLFGRRLWVAFPSKALQLHRDAEVKAAEANHDSVLLQALNWLHSSSYNPRNIDFVRFAFAGLPFGFSSKLTVDTNLRYKMQRKLDALVCDNLNIEADIAAQCTHSEFTLRSGLILGLNIRPCTINVSALTVLISKKTSLTPALWQALFERDQYAQQLSNSNGRRFITVLLPILKLATDDQYRTQSVATNWTLPSATPLINLCSDDPRMLKIILDSMYRTVLPQRSSPFSSTDHLEAIDNPTHSLDSPIILHVILSIADSLRSTLAPSRDAVKYVDELLTACEDTLFSSAALPSDWWCKPAFYTVLHRCQEVRLMSLTSDRSKRLVNFHPSLLGTASLALMMQYLLDVLEHPTPLARRADFSDEVSLFTFMQHLFTSSVQDTKAFQYLVEAERDILSVFRRCFPINFNHPLRDFHRPLRISRSRHQVSQCCFDYVSFISSQQLRDDSEKQQKQLDMITQPTNLALLMFLAAETNFQELVDVVYPLHANPDAWVAAADIVTEELRQSAASGLASWSIYVDVARVLCSVGLDDYVLYSYTSPVIELERWRHLAARRFRFVGDVLYGPFAVYATCAALVAN